MRRLLFVPLALTLILAAGTTKAGAVDKGGPDASAPTLDAASTQSALSTPSAVSAPKAISTPDAVSAQNALSRRTAVSIASAVSQTSAVSIGNAIPPPGTEAAAPAPEPAAEEKREADPEPSSAVLNEASPDRGAQNPRGSPEGAAEQSPNTLGQIDTNRPARQPKRIMGVMPNFLAVSAGETPPPPSAREAFGIATRNSFDYSAFLFTGITSLLAEADNKHAQLGKGIEGYGQYYWRGFADKTDGNYWVMFVLPTVLRQDERYYSLGRGSVWKRLGYAASRVLVDRNYGGQDAFNAPEILGRGIAQGVSMAYYPSQSRTVGSLASKYALSLVYDALTNVFREFWPDIEQQARSRHP